MSTNPVQVPRRARAKALTNRSVIAETGIFVVEKDEQESPPATSEAKKELPRAEDSISEKEKATAVVVSDAGSRALAANQCVRLKSLIEEAKSRFDPIVAAAHAAHAEACKQRTAVIAPLDEAYRLIGSKIGAWDLAEKQRLEEEERRLMREAQEAALVSREAEIEDAERNGASPEEVAAMCDMPVVAAPILAPRRISAGPVSSRTALKARVTNKLALVKFVGENPQYLNLIDENQAALNRLAAALGTAMRIPGVELAREAIVATRTAPRKGAR